MKSSSSKAGRMVAAILALAGLVAVFYNLVVDNTPKGEVRKIEGYTPWSEEAVDLAGGLPVQNGGRIKPLSTQAAFTMLGIHGARSMKVTGDDGKEHKLSPTDWMLDTLFRPTLAVQLPTFRIDNSNVLKSIGVDPRGRRDRYSYQEIEPGIEKLVDLAKSYEKIDSKKRDPEQQQVIDLAYNIRNYESYLSYFSFARFGADISRETGQELSLSQVLGMAPRIISDVRAAQAEGRPIEVPVRILLEKVLDSANFAKFGIFLLPPVDSGDRLWLSAGNAIMNTMTAEEGFDVELAIGDVKALEAVGQAEPDSDKFREHLAALEERISKRADNRGENRLVGLEAAYYQKNWFLYALVLFLMGTLTGLAMWAVGGARAGRYLAWATLGLTSAGLVYCIIAIVKRCVIMQRPPVGNLYDTIIFIGTTVVLISLIIEWMTKRRFALGLAPMLGTLLIVLARRYELGDAKDHMDPLVAVLRSNYWLTTHVITITLGYSAGLLCAMLSCFYLLARGLGLDNGDKAFRRSVTRAVYGMVCLCLLLSLVGTVLGGIWANDSWGRFWGWDPKENGALLIVLWTLAILHARLGGFIQEWGLHLASVFTACIVAFSWWHVNFLGVGLHNYGFTAGESTIWLFYGVMLVFLIFGAIVRFLDVHGKRIEVAPKGAPLQA
jgi:ABC-type transport system involved in cytochrome c biogenesis permease subunit